MVKFNHLELPASARLAHYPEVQVGQKFQLSQQMYQKH